MSSAESTSYVRALRSVARSLRHTPDRTLHPVRRRAALRRLTELGLPRTVLFICHGNICRSPYAEHAFVRLLPPELREFMLVGSAGFTGPGRGSPPEAIAVAGERGIDLRAHRAQLLGHEMIAASDVVVVMDAAQRQRLCGAYGADPRRTFLLGDLDPQPIDTRTVRDPIMQPREVFATSYDRIDRCLAAMFRAISGGAEPAPPAPVEVAPLPDAGTPGVERAQHDAPPAAPTPVVASVGSAADGSSSRP